MKESPTPQPGEAANPTVRCHTNPPRRILVVDDDFESREISSYVLAHSGCEVTTARDGAVAWQALNTGHYDLLITNYRMPGMSGVELIMKLRAAHGTLPVIMAAAQLPTDQFARYPWLKPAALLLQPCTGAELWASVDKVLSAAETARGQISPTPIRPSKTASHWWAELLILLRSPVFP